jgi:hypothetical protein
MPSVALAERLLLDNIRLFLASRLPDEGKAILREMFVEQDSEDLISSFEDGLSSSDIAVFIVLEWDDLLSANGFVGGDILFEHVSNLGDDVNVVTLTVQTRDSREIGTFLYRLGDGSLEKYECVVQDFFERIRRERVRPILNWENCR